jgi:hypothetical protein
MALQITKGKTPGAVRAVIYGTEGIGKSTLAAQIPGALFLDVEGGADQIGIDRLRDLDWRGIEAAVRDLTANAQGYSALVIDTADWCEKALIENLLKRKGQDSIEGFGYGKGYTMIQEEFARFLGTLDELIAKGIHVVFVAHSTVKRLSPPDQTDGYDRYEMKLTKQVSPLLKEWADVVLFCNYKIQIVEGTDGRTKAQGGKDRLIFTAHSPAWDAKNRFGLPEEMPMKFDGIAHLFGGAATLPMSRAVPEIAAAGSTVATATVTPAAATAAPADEIPGLEEPADPTKALKVPANVATWLDANKDKVNAYLVRVNWIATGRTWRDLPEDKMASVVAKTDKFARAAGIPVLSSK